MASTAPAPNEVTEKFEKPRHAEEENVDSSSNDDSSGKEASKVRSDGKYILDHNDCYDKLGYSWYVQHMLPVPCILSIDELIFDRKTWKKWMVGNGPTG